MTTNKKLTLCWLSPKGRQQSHLCVLMKGSCNFLILSWQTLHDISLRPLTILRDMNISPRLPSLFWRLESKPTCKNCETFGIGEDQGVCARAAGMWMSVFPMFSIQLLWNLVQTVTHVLLRWEVVRPIKSRASHPTQWQAIYALGSGCAVPGTARSARKAQVLHQAVCRRPTFAN